MAAMGAAIGTGNIWRFSKEAASNGGGSFLLAYVLLLFIWSIPLLMTEFAIGKATRKGTVGAFNIFAGRNYAWMGMWMNLYIFSWERDSIISSITSPRLLGVVMPTLTLKSPSTDVIMFNSSGSLIPSWL